MIEVRVLEKSHAPACDAVLATLPTFFGDPGGNAMCAEAVRTQRGWVACEGDDVIGFITVAPTTEQTVEITWMAVRAYRRRSGIGRLLVERAADDARSAGAHMLLVKTAGPSSPEPLADPTDNYDGTRAFYKRVGFTAIEELTPQGWNQTALLLVRPLR